MNSDIEAIFLSSIFQGLLEHKDDWKIVNNGHTIILSPKHKTIGFVLIGSYITHGNSAAHIVIGTISLDDVLTLCIKLDFDKGYNLCEPHMISRRDFSLADPMVFEQTIKHIEYVLDNKVLLK